MKIRHLYLSPAHVYVGRYGKPAGTEPMISVDEVECVAGKGLRGDRYFDFKEDYKGQITFFAMEVWEALQRELQLPGALPQATRRNAFVRELDCSAMIGHEFDLQGIRFLGIEECRPCHWMNLALGAGAEDWLRGRAGLRGRILTDGILRVSP